MRGDASEEPYGLEAFRQAGRLTGPRGGWTLAKRKRRSFSCVWVPRDLRIAFPGRLSRRGRDGL